MDVSTQHDPHIGIVHDKLLPDLLTVVHATWQRFHPVSVWVEGLVGSGCVIEAGAVRVQVSVREHDGVG